MAPEQVITRIAEYASTFSEQAGVGGCETAGWIVSVLATHPHLIPDFLNDPGAVFIDRDEMRHIENGCLSWHAKNGEIVTPAELRAEIATPDN